MSIAGNLKTMELSELLQWLSQSQKSGTLVITSEHEKKQIFFEDGQIVAIGSSVPTEQLGHFLVGQGYLSEEQLVRSVRLQEITGMMLGKVLVTDGLISEPDLYNLLTMRAQEQIFDLFDWSAGEFQFVEDEGINTERIPMVLDVAAIVLQGMERLDEWNRIRGRIPSQQVVPVAVGPLATEDLAPGERKILEEVDDDRTIEEICMETHSSEFFVCRTLFRAAERGALKLVRPRFLPVEEPASEELAAVEAETLIDIANSCIQRGDLSRALRHLRAARTLDPHNEATEQAVGEAEERMRRTMRKEGLSLKSVPLVSLSASEIENLNLSPEEGFVLSRIDGTYDIESILKVSPMPHLDAQLVFRKLLQAGHIQLADGPI